jgi:hypothetical protein
MKFDRIKISRDIKQQVYRQASKALEVLVKQEVGFDTGLLRASVHTEKVNNDLYVIGHDPHAVAISSNYRYPEGNFKDYGAIHELGRGEIDQKKKGKKYPLHWKKGGEDIYAWKVKAVKPKKFYKKALKKFDIKKDVKVRL